MLRQRIFTFRVNKEERQIISKLAKLLHRSQSDAIRFILAEAINALENQQPNKTNKYEVKNEKQ